MVVPTQKDIEDALLRRKKQELLQMYALEDVEHVSVHHGRNSPSFYELVPSNETRAPKTNECQKILLDKYRDVKFWHSFWG